MPMPQYQMPQYQVSQPHTLPPLQPHHSQSPNPYMGQPYRPDMSRFPATSAHDVYATSAGPIGPHNPVNSLPPTSFLAHPGGQPQGQPPQGYQSPQTLLPPSSGAQTYPQPIAPAPPRDRRSDYATMPSGAFSHPEGKGPIWANADGMPTNGLAPIPGKEPPRTQVVGSQGRRGILPSVPGRAAVSNGVNGTAKSTTIPAKDADGKFPCPHCNKTYLHAKHLKRHLLRHTGDRPYMCVLCKDTFSRSDILKRHFQKCSLRRGNPTGASHLSHPQAHLKRSQAAANAAKSVQEEVSNSIPPSNGLVGTTYGNAPVNGHGHGLASAGRPGPTEQQPLGFSMSSVNGLNNGHLGDAFSPSQAADQRASWMAAHRQSPYLVQPASDGQVNNIDRNLLEQAKPPMIQDPKRPMMPHQPGQPGELDWATMFPPGAPEGYMNPVFPQTMAPGHESIHSHVDPDRKYYPATTAGHQDGTLNGLYLASTSMSGDGMRDPSGVPSVAKTNPQEPITT
ncbi:hypothetical protein BGW36DRAFT_431860 [Talaromyces proteolyticus]|uniref:C2H2-type domain-containing protein n=1 Tax=Talaromyces proteolyticus TaxID=1131652 RepID=A0AAD4KHI1_9EURO|nr:uncharacterized protein BGW36DRAFT_431860 [Talaromyces proteolyticus]KAH8691309.1 hypothetical protein BGW36DRAFT_431860 [Talaromyces proteolyticus]